MLWLNSVGEYHDDDEGRQLFEKLNEIIPDRVTTFIMLTVIRDKTLAVFALANIIAIILGDIKELAFDRTKVLRNIG